MPDTAHRSFNLISIQSHRVVYSQALRTWLRRQVGLKSTLVPTPQALCWGEKLHFLHTKAAFGALFTHERDTLLFSLPRLRNRGIKHKEVKKLPKVIHLAGGEGGTQTRNLTQSPGS